MAVSADTWGQLLNRVAPLEFAKTTVLSGSLRVTTWEASHLSVHRVRPDSAGRGGVSKDARPTLSGGYDVRL